MQYLVETPPGYFRKVKEIFKKRKAWITLEVEEQNSFIAEINTYQKLLIEIDIQNLGLVPENLITELEEGE